MSRATIERFYAAFAALGWLLGWTPFLRAKVRAQAAANLKRFLAKG